MEPPYYRDYVEAAGHAQRYPFWVFEIDFASERYREVSQLVLSAPQREVRPINKRRWNAELETLRELFNAGMSEEWEMHHVPILPGTAGTAPERATDALRS